MQNTRRSGDSIEATAGSSSTTRQPHRTSRNHEDVGLDSRASPRLSRPTRQSSLGDENSYLSMPTREEKSERKSSLTRGFSKGLVSQTVPTHRQATRGKSPTGGSPTRKLQRNPMFLNKKPNAKQQEVLEHIRHPPDKLRFPSPGEDKEAPSKQETQQIQRSSDPANQSVQAPSKPHGRQDPQSSSNPLDAHIVTMMSSLNVASNEELNLAPPTQHESTSINLPSLVSSGDASIPSIQSRGGIEIIDGMFPDQQSKQQGIDYAVFAYVCASAGRLKSNVEFYTEQEMDEHDRSWNEVREWLRVNGQPDSVLPYLEVANEHGRNALHIACLKQPPSDVIYHIIEILEKTNRLDILHSQDFDGRTPLHLVCANFAPPDTLRELAHWSIDYLRMKDNIGLTPLHIALIGPFRKHPDLIELLNSTGACEEPSTPGASNAELQFVLPIHYACASGAPEATLGVLVDRYKGKDGTKEFDGGFTQYDKKGRTTLHWAILSCKDSPEAAPLTVRWLLQERPRLVNMANGQTLYPIAFLLSTVNNARKTYMPSGDAGADELRRAELRKDAVKSCFELMIETKWKICGNENLKLDGTVLREIRNSPEWLYPTLILSRYVQDILDRKMKSKFPTVILMLDLFMQIMVMISFKLNVENSLECRYDASQSSRFLQESQDVCTGNAIPPSHVSTLYIGATYFLLRELVEVISLVLSQDFLVSLKGWILHLDDILDLLYIATVYAWGIILHQGLIEKLDAFSTAAAFSVAILWIKFFIFLRTISFDFSVFISGVFFVGKSLIPYILCLLCFLFAFTQIFYTIFFSDPVYGCSNSTMGSDEVIEDIQSTCFVGDILPFCTLFDSFLRVYTMFLGEVDEKDFEDSTVATVFFAVYMFIMVILLANVLIAIVTRYYKFVQDGQGIIVFYTNRLYFLAETDVIKDFPRFKHVYGPEGSVDSAARHSWSQLVDMLFMREAQAYEMTRDFKYYVDPDKQWWNLLTDDISRLKEMATVVTRFFLALAAVVAMSMWFVFGLITVGLGWPPQIREWFFSNKKQKGSVAEQEQENAKQREAEEKKTRELVKATRDEFRDALAEHQKQRATHKAIIDNKFFEIKAEMRRLKIKAQQLLEVLDRDQDSDSVW